MKDLLVVTLFFTLLVELIHANGGLLDKMPIPQGIKDKIPQGIKDKIPDELPNPLKCAEGKAFMAQGPMCQMTCEKLLDAKTHAINQVNPLCKLKRPGCFCQDGNILRKSDNTCISKTKCLGSKVLG